jgi:hypothetical protein
MTLEISSLVLTAIRDCRSRSSGRLRRKKQATAASNWIFGVVPCRSADLSLASWSEAGKLGHTFLSLPVLVPTCTECAPLVPANNGGIDRSNPGVLCSVNRGEGTAQGR